MTTKPASQIQPGDQVILHPVYNEGPELVTRVHHDQGWGETTHDNFCPPFVVLYTEGSPKGVGSGFSPDWPLQVK